MRSVDVRVTGRVQGVFFRVSTRNRAVELGVAGTVRNELDGSVSISAEAEPPVLERFLEWVGNGPPNARVDALDVRDRDPRGFSGFEVTG